ncbi:MAG: cbb3-type cytochrome oxidase assembly protein CcoS [Weeksellaceae bacterium]|nr:cbb3-type cytochrome oxidase assembly protein CcoS [Weeksellaceae bacterium]
MIFLLCVSLSVALVFLGVFIWNVKTGQYEDDYSPAHRILFEDREKEKNNKQTKNSIKG